jgi:hypothetical protein
MAPTISVNITALFQAANHITEDLSQVAPGDEVHAATMPSVSDARTLAFKVCIRRRSKLQAFSEIDIEIGH